MKISLKKTVTAAMLAALTVALSGFYIPIGVSKCYPIQHMVNVLCAVFLGPGYGVMAAFCTSLIRNLMGKEAALFTYVMPFLMSTCCGTIMAAAFVGVLEKSHVISYIRGVMGDV